MTNARKARIIGRFRVLRRHVSLPATETISKEADVIAQSDVVASITARSTRSGLFVLLVFVCLNAFLLVAYLFSGKFGNSELKDQARLKGEFSCRTALTDFPLLMYALQSPLEQNLDSAIYQFHQGKAPQVVLLGSSLMQYPTWLADKGNVHPRESFFYFRSRFIEEQCKQARNIFNISVPLLNVSDAARLTEKFLTGTRRPQVLVYGVGPRDFYDTLQPAPCKTNYFNFLADSFDYVSNSERYFANPVETLSNLSLRAFFLYTKKDEVLALAKNSVKELLNKRTMPEPDNLFPMGPQRNLDEYALHYRDATAESFDRQFFFLDHLLTVCSQQHISVILLNMPITRENAELLPGSLYSAYVERLRDSAKKHNHQFVDVYHDPKFRPDDFLDSVHLNAQGSRKFLELVAPIIDATVLQTQ